MPVPITSPLVVLVATHSLKAQLRARLGCGEYSAQHNRANASPFAAGGKYPSPTLCVCIKKLQTHEPRLQRTDWWKRTIFPSDTTYLLVEDGLGLTTETPLLVVIPTLALQRDPSCSEGRARKYARTERSRVRGQGHNRRALRAEAKKDKDDLTVSSTLVT